MRKTFPALALIFCILALASCKKDTNDTPKEEENPNVHTGRGVRVLGQMMNARPATLPTMVIDLSLDNSGGLHWAATVLQYSQQGAYSDYHRGSINATTGATIRPDSAFLPYPTGYLIAKSSSFRQGTGVLYHSYQKGFARGITGEDGSGFGYTETSDKWTGVLEVAHNGDFMLKCQPYAETIGGVGKYMAAGMLAHESVPHRAAFVVGPFIAATAVQPLDDNGHGVIFAAGHSRMYAFAMDSTAADSLVAPPSFQPSTNSVMRIRSSADGSRYIISVAESGLITTFFFNKSTFRLSQALPPLQATGEILTYDTDEEGGIWYLSNDGSGTPTNLHHRTASGDQVAAADFVKGGGVFLRVLGNRPYITVGETICTVN